MSSSDRSTGKTFRLVLSGLKALSNGECIIMVHKTIEERDRAHKMAQNATKDIAGMDYLRKEIRNRHNGGMIVFTSLTEFNNSKDRNVYRGIKACVLRDHDCWDFDDKRNLSYVGTG